MRQHSTLAPRSDGLRYDRADKGPDTDDTNDGQCDRAGSVQDRGGQQDHGHESGRRQQDGVTGQVLGRPVA